MPSVALRNANECFPAGDIVVFTCSFQSGARGRHKMEKPSAAVSRIRIPSDQPQHLQLVDDATERDRFDFDKLSESRLIDALVFREVGQNLPLRSGETTRVLLEPLLQQAGYVVQQEGERRWI